ncbi:MAG: carbon-nitrogen hydrolase family protein [Candidatus Eisenbacteria bacterium]
MTATRGPYVAAAVQASSVFLDRERSTDKACALIADAASRGARLIVLPEAFIPAYPVWVWVLPLTERPEVAAVHRLMVENAVQVPGPVTERLGEAARAANAWVVVGVDEAGPAGTLYNTILIFDDTGRLVESRRKLMPTGGERMVWKAGEAVPPRVHDTPLGRIGGLLCWENYMPLARYALYRDGMQVLVAPTWDRADAWVASMRHIAREGRTYVIGCCQAVRRDDIPDSRPFKRFLPADKEWVNDGNSVIVDPDGAVLAGPLNAREGILLAEIDPGKTLASRWIFDCVGHYQRDDVFEFGIRGAVVAARDPAPAGRKRRAVPARPRRRAPAGRRRR